MATLVRIAAARGRALITALITALAMVVTLALVELTTFLARRPTAAVRAVPARR
ncbi:MAG: hypothetical protein HYR74_12155 [Candidatus Eisenbacteria bacterium]|nr:hypothetical protein [Candidatus Eisenbacteria bacterium]